MKSNKLFLLCILLTVISVASNAQTNPIKFSAGVGISSYNSGGSSTTGFGIDLIGKTNLSENFEGFIQTGYNNYSANGGSWGVIPVLLGANYKAGNFKPGLGLGYGRLQLNSGGIGGFAFSPQLGYSFDKFDLVGHYTSISINNGSINVFGLKALYNF
jgi:hypothetical protein